MIRDFTMVQFQLFLYNYIETSRQQLDVHAHHNVPTVEFVELQSFSSTASTALSPMGFERSGDPQQSVMITGPSDHKLTSEIMDAPTKVFDP